MTQLRCYSLDTAVSTVVQEFADDVPIEVCQDCRENFAAQDRSTDHVWYLTEVD